MKKNIKTLLSIVLTTAILLTQASVFAVPLIDAIDKIPVSDVFVIAEDVSKRGEFEKHYLCSDGTFIVASYAEAIHYKNENGEWVDVDNEVSYNKSTQSYRAGNETFGVEFASVSDVSKLVTMNSGDHVISWGLTTDKSNSLLTAEKSATVSSITAEEVIAPSVTLKNAPVSTKNTKSLITDSKTFELSKASGCIAYEKIIAGSPEISVNYSVYRNKIEEDIYINSKTDAKSISMNLSVGTLVACVNFDNSVWLLDDEGEPQYTIGVPYMEDAVGEILNDIKVTVTQNGSDCVITYTPSEAWLASEDRVYPILLDPSITSREYSSNIVDTYVYEGDTANHSSEKKLYAGIRNSKIHRSFIKITNLPNVDSSMPVIGATLSLKLTTGSTTGRTVALYKLNSDWNQSTITYANQPSFTEADKIGTCPFNASAGKFVFDLTADVATMYNEFLAGVNYGYVLKYDNESKTNPDYNATYTMEQTTVADRPLLTVNYGYSLPTGLEVGGVYALQNRGSYGYLTVHNGTDANDVNVYLKSTASDALETNQQFKLEYVSSTGAYRFRAMSSSDANRRVLDIVRSGGYVNNGGNVQIYNPTDELANEWFIVGTGSNYFKIIPRTNMSLSLTAYPGLDGTATGTTPTSTGNVFVATTVENSNFQQWRIVDMSTGEGVSGGGNSDIVPNGTYYFNNRDSGKYLHKSNVVEYVEGQSGLISDLGNRIRWTLTCVFDGMYTIRSVDDPTLFIVPDDVSSRIILDTLPSGTDIPDEYLWKITGAHGGGVKIQNVGTNEYLYSFGATNQLSSTLPSTSSVNYDRYAWRMANVNMYGNTSEHSYRELEDCIIDDVIVDVGQVVAPQINSSPNSSIWESNSDFEYYYLSGTINCIVTNDNGCLVGVSPGIAIYRAKHKVTGQVYTFNVCVDYYTYQLIEFFGFTEEAALLIRGVYDRVESSSTTGNAYYIAWAYSRLLSMFNYNNVFWRDTAGEVVSYSDLQSFFLETLNYTYDEYTLIKESIQAKHTTSYPDFSHMQASLSARLAYKLNKDGFISNVGTFCSDEDVSYLAGWLGDATIAESGTTIMDNGDYCADLDAENIYREISSSVDYLGAICNYYRNLTSTNNRAHVFLNHIDYATVQSKVFHELIDKEIYVQLAIAYECLDYVTISRLNALLNDEEFHWNVIEDRYHDTYNFLLSLQEYKEFLCEY